MRAAERDEISEGLLLLRHRCLQGSARACRLLYPAPSPPSSSSRPLAPFFCSPQPQPMGINIRDPLVQIKVTQSVCGFVAICMTVSRLWLRRGRYWWDDAWAFFSLLCLLIQFVSVFMHVENPNDLSKTSRIAAYYLMATTFYTVIWSARLSILFSIIRIDPDPVWRLRLRWIAGIFIGAIVFFLAQLMWVCEPEPSWKNAPSPQCKLNKEVAICQLVSDVIADLLLIILPLRLIHGIKDRVLRRRLIVIFSTSIVTTIVSLVHAVYIILGGGIKVIISALVEDCMSLSVANIPVTVTALWRILGIHTQGRADDSYTDEPSDGPRFSTFRFKSRLTGVFTTTGGGGGGGATRAQAESHAANDKAGAGVGLVSAADTYDGRAHAKTKGSHYVSVGSLQGESQWESEASLSVGVDADAARDAHYISIGSVRQDTVHDPAEAAVAVPLRTLGAAAGGRRIPVVRIAQ
ncbi:hypothetical protein DENSPDRAFT_832309 [Dentipellis sp. KUC8613]|nr:hypothetical protein DENSPDRAFT_832309 [Dentipellis sp. KUC8613]